MTNMAYSHSRIAFLSGPHAMQWLAAVDKFCARTLVYKEEREREREALQVLVRLLMAVNNRASALEKKRKETTNVLFKSQACHLMMALQNPSPYVASYAKRNGVVVVRVNYEYRPACPAIHPIARTMYGVRSTQYTFPCRGPFCRRA